VDSTLRDDFAAAIAGPDAGVDLFGAALVIARVSGSSVSAARCVRRLDAMAEAASLHAGPSPGVEVLTQAIDHHLFTVLGFRGNASSYDDPRNSYLDIVLDRRVGIPITLSLVYMEIARRVGMRCDGIGYPGHFVVRCGEPEDGVFIDPFHQGARLDRNELLANLQGINLAGSSAESYLAGITRRQILQRMLYNLRNTFQESKDINRWHATVDLLLCIEPWNASLTGERGMLAFRLGNSSGALDDLERYVGATAPESASSGARRLLHQLRIQLASEERT
jgi:regulator of sirC expression with transglutaminase-like and TPR domain